MKLQLTSVRGKLTALVAFSAIVLVAALPMLAWMMDRQLVDQVHERVPGAVQGFAMELDEDLLDLTTIVEQLSSEAALSAALRAKAARDVEASGRIFHRAYPQIDLVFFDVMDKRLAEIEVNAPDFAQMIPGVETASVSKPFRGVVEHGCEVDPGAPPAFVFAKRVADAGMIVACLPLDADYLNEVQRKLGVELAFVRPGTRAVIGSTNRFPVDRISQATATSALVQSGQSEWALVHVTPQSMTGQNGRYGVVIALDVTDIRSAVRHNLLRALAVLAAATVISLLLGARLASTMSRALSRVNVALVKLQRHEYAHVDMIHTGDEIEDLAIGFNTMVDGLKERDKLRTTFGKYMTQTVIEHLMNGKVQLGGETLTVTILFSDIRGFTTISEEMNDAQALVGLLNEYFTEMVSIIIREDGVVDKYIGDAIMAVFGAPVSRPDDAVRAVRAAVCMRRALADLNVRLALRGVSPLRTGIGIHTGEVVAGNIGSEQRMEYTVIGDAVNLASRLETSTKELQVDVLISESTFELVKNTCETRAIGPITVKGRSEPVMTYEVRSLKDSLVT
jgi:adenylate cyclase